MEDIKKRFCLKDFSIGTERDYDTREVTDCYIFWNGEMFKYKTKEEALNALIEHINNEIGLLILCREELLIELSCHIKSGFATKREMIKTKEQVLEICEALAHIQDLIKRYNEIIDNLKNKQRRISK